MDEKKDTTIIRDEVGQEARKVLALSELFLEAKGGIDELSEDATDGIHLILREIGNKLNALSGQV